MRSFAHLSREARLMTDEATMYRRIGREFAEHSAVHHYNEEYVRGDVTTNTRRGCLQHLQNGAWAASINTVASATCIVTWQSLSSATATARPTVATTLIAPRRLSGASSASG